MRGEESRGWKDYSRRRYSAGHSYPAHELYDNRTHGRLVERFGLGNVYILSAGWGLLGAGFLTPYYDITYSQSAEPYKRAEKI